jgi:hypothetical protein
MTNRITHAWYWSRRESIERKKKPAKTMHALNKRKQCAETPSPGICRPRCDNRSTTKATLKRQGTVSSYSKSQTKGNGRLGSGSGVHRLFNGNRNGCEFGQLFPLPSSGLEVLKALGRAGHTRGELGTVGVGIVLLLEVGEGVVHLAVLGLIGSHDTQQVDNAVLARRELEVVLGNLRGFHVLPLRQVSGLEIGDRAGVGDDCFLLEVADEAVAGLGGDQVGHEEEVEEDTGVC